MSVSSYICSLPHHPRDFLKQPDSSATLSASFICSVTGKKKPQTFNATHYFGIVITGLFRRYRQVVKWTGSRKNKLTKKTPPKQTKPRSISCNKTLSYSES